MGVTFQREIASSDLYQDIGHLVRDHFSLIHSQGNVDLVLTHFLTLESKGMFRVFVIRDDHAKPIGYATFIVHQSPHDAGIFQATQDSLYLLGDIDNRTKVISDFIRWCDAYLEKDGVSIVYRSLPVKKNFMRRLSSFGYEPFEIVYSRRLNQCQH